MAARLVLRLIVVSGLTAVCIARNAPESTEVDFELYTKLNKYEPSLLADNELSFANSNFNRTNPTRIVIHGWMSPRLISLLFSSAYFDRGNNDVNFIAVEWRRGALSFNYAKSREQVPRVGEQLAKFIDFMCAKDLINISDLTIVGHSLGAHIAGIGKLK